jgi:thiosulfate/3-mercaptopyruvate sulfurtransferase
MTSQYHNPDMLVTTDWVEKHRSDTKNYRIVESDEDVLLYDTGHIPEAVKIDWVNDLQDDTVRDYIDHERFAKLCEKHGINNDTIVVFYGDNKNWWACYALWVFQLYGHAHCKIMDGGRDKWKAENRPMTTDRPTYPTTIYTAKPADMSIRALRDHVQEHIDRGNPLLDVRSTGEYTGEMLHMPNYPQEGALRGGHIPGAVNVPWSTAVNDDGTFKSRDELEGIYQQQQGLQPTDDVVAYCRIGERSSHTWFVLTHLLGFDRVRNYDGSWTEWGNLVGAPIERGMPEPVTAG